MENEQRDSGMDFVEDLCFHYREIERSKALHLDMCDLILSSGNRHGREWLEIGETTFPPAERP